MSIPVLHEKILLRPDDLKPLTSDFRVVGAFNPAAARFGDDTLLLVRVAEAPHFQSGDTLISPRAIWPDGELTWTFDVFDREGASTSDPRIFQLPDGRIRLRYISHLCLVRFNNDGTKIDEVSCPRELLPQEPWEELGIEDPRITKIGDTYHITYVAISRQAGVATALMTTKDFATFERHGIIFPTENKNVVLLPELWGEHFVAYHRPVSHYGIDAPSIHAALSPDCIFWGKHKLLMGPRSDNFDSIKVGAGAPPIRLPQGWLLLYHGVGPASDESPAGYYCVGAALLDLDDPTRVIARSPEPLICPERLYEREGYVPNVIFPTGAVLRNNGEILDLYVGAADEVVVQLSVQTDAVLSRLESQ
jgi:predicted GH43/DUF377 family glycosyl hydrolase